MGPGFPHEIGEQCVTPHPLIDRFPHMAVEVAIWAFGDAERPVDVEGQSAPLVIAIGAKQSRLRLGECPAAGLLRRCAARNDGSVRHRSAATSFRKASARWLMP